MSAVIGPTWTQAGPAEWTNETAPGYIIVHVGGGYEVLLGNRRVINRVVPMFADAVDVVTTDMDREV